ncbi:MAG: LamG domain-containing protein, partial [Planctomycetota bacterium]|nr:LamG domain-containing protein [Planctomycetota bacterium]
VLPQAVPLAASRQGNPSPIPAPPGLIAWWSGDGHASDFVGGHHGELVGSATFGTGVVGQAFVLDGINGYVRVPNSDALNPKAEFSIECWVQSTCVGSRNIISKWNLGTQDFSYCLQENGWYDRSAHRFTFALSESSQIRSRFDLANLHGRRITVPHMWNHVAATFDGNAVRLYVNGSLDGTQAPATGRIHSGTADIIIGAFNAQNLSGQMGTPRCVIDELCLYDRALTPADIEAIHRADAAGKIKPEKGCPE